MSFDKGNFNYPECWSNDVRMSVLFAPFRHKSVNPTDWDSKMKFWTNLIDTWCKHSKRPLIDVSTLKDVFSRKGIVPACLEDVLSHLSSAKVVIPKDVFMASTESWKSWAVKVLITNPLKWTFNTVKNTIISVDNRQEISYVYLPVIKYLGEGILKSIPSSCPGKIMSFEDLKKLSGISSDEDMSLVLHWLQSQGNAGVCHENELTLVKLSKNSSKQLIITQTDKDIYSLEEQAKLLEENIKKLENEEKAALELTKKHLANKMKNLAKISLRRKKVIEKTIEKRAAVLETIQEILHQIDQVKFQTEIVDCYQKGIASLKRVLKETGLDRETVKETMEELREVLSKGSEIDDALTQPLDPDASQELLDELNELLLEEAPQVPEDELPVAVDVAKENKKAKDDGDELGTRLQALSI